MDLGLFNADLTSFFFLFIGFFFIAIFYSSVGFGGGSSYLALLSLFSISFLFIRSNALLCNLVVVSGSTFLYRKKGYFHLKEFLPFIITSIPMTFIGAQFRLAEQIFFILLGLTLFLASISLFVQALNRKTVATNHYPKYLSYILGGGIGFLSGLVGIGGGIFLAPILHYLKWGKPFKIAALTAFFILVNSVSGLIGLQISNNLYLMWSETLFLISAVFIGGQIGIRTSLNIASPNIIRIITAVLILVVAIRILITKGLFIS